MFTGSIKISELDALTTVVTADYFPLVQSSSFTTFRVNITTLNNWFRISGSALSASWASRSLDSVQSVSASWASSSINSIQTISASFASASISSSYSLSSSAALRAVTASHALVAISASFAPFTQSYQESGSWASASFSASYALSASFAPAIGDTVPVGTIMAFGGQVAPQNWLECDGTAYLTSSFPELYAAISSSDASASYGYTCDVFGNRDASGSYFKMPDFRGEFLRGWDHSRGIDTGRIFASLQTASLGNHYHGIGLESSYGGLPAQFLKTAPWTSPDGSWTSMVIIGNSFGGYTGTLVAQAANAALTNGLITSGPINASETRPRNVAIMWCIKYSNTINFATTGSATLAGDVTGTIVNNTVIKLRNVPLSSSAPADGDLLLYSSASNSWYPGSPNIGGSPGLSYLVAYPGGCWRAGSDLLVYNYNPNTGRRNLVKINMSTNVVTYEMQWPQDAWSTYGHVFRKTTDAKLHLMMWTDTDLYDYDIDDRIVTRITGSGGQYHDNPVQISWASGSLRPTVWSLYGSFYAAAGGGDVPSLYVAKTYWNGASWVRSTSPLLNTTGVGNGTEFLKFCNQSTNPGAVSNTLLWDYNYIKKRYYLIDNSTSYLHIFTQNTGDIVTNFNTSSIDYEKTLAVPLPAVDQWAEVNCEKMIVDFDPDTGEERGICMVRRGQFTLTGTAIYVYWPE